MIREARSALDNWLGGKVAPTVLALLCVGAIGSGINLARSVDRLAEKVEYAQRRDDAQDERLNRHDERITYLERLRSNRADAEAYVDSGGSRDE